MLNGTFYYIMSCHSCVCNCAQNYPPSNFLPKTYTDDITPAVYTTPLCVALIKQNIFEYHNKKRLYYADVEPIPEPILFLMAINCCFL